MYGVIETNPMVEHTTYNFERGPVSLKQLSDEGGHVTRVRLLTEGYGGIRLTDISYIHAMIGDEAVTISDLPSTNTLWGKGGVKAVFVRWASEEGVYAKGLGLLDENNWSVLY